METYGRPLVSLRGDTLLVASSEEYASKTGAVYVFTRSGETWTERTRLIASDRAVGDRFAQTCVSNDLAMVGAWGDDDNGMDSGSVYVFGSGVMATMKRAGTDMVADIEFNNRRE